MTTNDLVIPEKKTNMIPTPRRDGVGENILNSNEINRLPVTDVVPTYPAVNGTYIFYDNGTTREMYVMLNGTWRKTTLT